MLRIYTPRWITLSVYYILKTLAAPVKLTSKAVGAIKDRFAAFKTYWNGANSYMKYRKKLPIDDKRIVLSPYSGENVSGNMFYMAEELLSRGGYDVFMVTHKPARDAAIFATHKMKLKLVRPNTPELSYALATAKFLATNTRLPDYFLKRDGQVFLNTWHGTPLKCLGYDVTDAYKELGGIQAQFLSADYVLFPNEHTRQKMLRCYGMDILFRNKGLLAGYPRNAAFFRNDKTGALREKLGLQGKKVYVYMPTWRGSSWDEKCYQYINDTETILWRLDQELADDIVVLYKLHNYAARDRKRVPNYKRLRPFPDNMDTYALLNIADALITDYSSVLYDFANTGKEIILYPFDAESYYKKRGMYCSLDELPFPRYTEINDLIHHINHGRPFVKDEAYAAFQRQYCAYDSLSTPEQINTCLLEGKAPESGELVDYKDTASFQVCFVSGWMNAAQKKDAEAFLRNNPDALIVIPERELSKETEALIHLIYGSNRPCLVVRMYTPASFTEKFRVKLYRKTGLCKKTVRHVCLREKERIFPGLVIASYTNMSNEPLFREMTRFLDG